MDESMQEYKLRYASMKTFELVDLINSSTLTEIAKQALKHELDSRTKVPELQEVTNVKISKFHPIIIIEKLWVNSLKTIGVILFITGICIIGFQVFSYLANGAWPQASLIELSSLGPKSFEIWLQNPTSWYGLHEIVLAILKTIPISLTLILLGYLIVKFNES